MDVCGGLISDSFVKMTGGTTERIITNDLEEDVLFKRCANTLSSGSVVGCAVHVSNHTDTCSLHFSFLICQ